MVGTCDKVPLLVIWPSQTPDCCGEDTVNIGVRQHKTNMMIIVTGERQGIADAEFLGEDILKMKRNQFYLGSSMERTFKYSKQDVNNAVTWK